MFTAQFSAAGPMFLPRAWGITGAIFAGLRHPAHVCVCVVRTVAIVPSFVLVNTIFSSAHLFSASVSVEYLAHLECIRYNYVKHSETQRNNNNIV